MAKYEITYACGHKEIVNLFGPMKERESKIAWYEKQRCPECASAGCELEGTPKQKKWAQEILSGWKKDPEKLITLNRFCLEIEDLGKDAQDAIMRYAETRRNEGVEDIFEEIAAETLSLLLEGKDAGWVIDNRFMIENPREYREAVQKWVKNHKECK